jgi:DNA-binding MurR/RpiR family transcriptional regulator
VPRSVADTTDSGIASFEERLANRFDHLAPAERRVAEQLIHLGPAALVLSAAALGEQLGTSDATVVRTAKALGYRSLAELRQSLAAETVTTSPAERMRRTLGHAEPRDLLANFAVEQIASLEALTRNVDQGAFNRAADLLANGDRIVWRGVGPSGTLADYGQLLAGRIGKASTSFVHTGTSFADELLGLRAGDAVVLLAYGPLQPHVDVMTERAMQLATPIVLVTDSLGRKLASRVDVILRAGRGTPGEFASHASTLVLIEALTLAVASRDASNASAALRTLNDLRASIAGRRLDVDAGP